jgi:hypothetical protein
MRLLTKRPQLLELVRKVDAETAGVTLINDRKEAR